MDNLSSTPKIEIKTVTIDGRKLTKSIFSQLGDYYCLNENLEFTGDNIIGYVNHNNVKYLLWVKNGLLKKTNLDSYRKVLGASSDTFAENISWFLRLTNIDYYIQAGAKGTLSDSIEDQDGFYQKVGKLRLFLNTIKPEMQVFV
jgi:hypothetical protein